MTFTQMLDKLNRFLFGIRIQERSLPLRDRISLVTMYTIGITFLFTSFFNARLIYDHGMFLSLVFVTLHVVLSIIGVTVFWITRSLRAARFPFAGIVLILIIQQFMEAGGVYGLGVLFLLMGFPIIYLFFGLGFGIFLMVSYSTSVILALQLGNYNRLTSIYNQIAVPGRMIYVVVLGTVMNIVVCFFIEMMLRHLTRSAYADQVTGLPNRVKLDEALSAELSRGGRANLTLIGVKMLNFNRINAMIGTDQGDLLLSQVARRFDPVHKELLLCSRWSGSLFMLLTRSGDYDTLHSLVTRMRDMLSTPYDVSGRSVTVLFSLAVSRYPDDALTPRQLLSNVISMIDRSSNRSGEIIMFNEESLRMQQYHFKLTESLNRIVPDRDFTLVYQPKVRLVDGACIGAEVLLRWRDPVLGQIPPGIFIPLAEQSGHILRITRWVVSKTLQDLADPELRHLFEETGVIHALNLSVMDLRDREFVPFLAEAVAQCSFCPSRIEFEITESVMIDDDPQIRKSIESIVDLGFRLAIDDFGTGYSSLSYLHKIRTNTLKIDQSFVRTIRADRPAWDQEGMPVIDAIISMGRSLGLDVTAEGVETTTQAEYLRKQGCQNAQGWLFSREVSFQEYLAYLNDHKIIAERDQS